MIIDMWKGIENQTGEGRIRLTGRQFHRYTVHGTGAEGTVDEGAKGCRCVKGDVPSS